MERCIYNKNVLKTYRKVFQAIQTKNMATKFSLLTEVTCHVIHYGRRFVIAQRYSQVCRGSSGVCVLVTGKTIGIRYTLCV